MNHSLAADAAFLASQHDLSNNNATAVNQLQNEHWMNVQVQELLESSSSQNSPKLLASANAYADSVAQELLTYDFDDDDAEYPLRVVASPSHDYIITTSKAANANCVSEVTRIVVLPNELFDKHDYRKGRCFEKRNAVVWNVAAHLQKNKKKHNVYWCTPYADARHPVLILLPQKNRNKFQLRLEFQMESLDWIPSSLRLVPNRCNLGSSPTKNNDATANGDSGSNSSIHYNHALTEIAAHTQFDLSTTDSIHDNSTATNSSPQAQAAVLLQIWCLQRGLWRGHDTLQPHSLWAILVYLERTHRIHRRMTPLQIVTVVFKLLAEELLTSSSSTKAKVMVIPVSDKTTEAQTIADCGLAKLYAETTRQSPLTDHDPPTLMELYQQQVMQPFAAKNMNSSMPAVLLDPSMMHNYLGRLSPAACAQLQRHAERSLQQQQQHCSCFQALFLQPARFWNRHDLYFSITLNHVRSSNNNNKGDISEYEDLARKIVSVVSRAAGDRVLDLSCLTTGNGLLARRNSNSNDNYYHDIPTHRFTNAKNSAKLLSSKKLTSPTGTNSIVLGVTVNPDTCFRIVDRGPPANSAGEEKAAFLDLWGEAAELRRFKDGAIVHAVVWDNNDDDDSNDKDGDEYYISFQNDDSWQGGIVERIVRHILKRHILRDAAGASAAVPQFSLRGMASTIDGVVVPRKKDDGDAADSNNWMINDPLAAHRAVMKAFDQLTDFLRKNSAKTIPLPGSSTELKSALGIPLSIDAVEALSPALRYAALYPPVPHPLLGGGGVSASTKKTTSGAVQTVPIEIQIRFGASSKWPTDLKAIGAAKTAMLIELANGIEELKKTSPSAGGAAFGPILVTASHADVCFKGYVFRVSVRSDPELKLLRELRSPSPEATHLLQTLTTKTVVAATHHTMVHAVYTKNPSSSATVRMAHRWLAAHLLSDHIPFEAVELMVAYIYTNRSSSPLDAPGTVSAGFLRFLNLLTKHDWARQPLIVDPQGHLNDDDHNAITARFEQVRGESYQDGPALYIVSPCDRGHLDTAVANGGSRQTEKAAWNPSFASQTPERVVLLRAIALAERSHAFLFKSLQDFDRNAWSAVFQESNESFRSYSALLRVDPAFVINKDASSTSLAKRLAVAVTNKSGVLESTYSMSMQHLAEGPRELRRKVYRNLLVDKDADGILLEWQPIQAMVQALRSKLGGHAVFFYNHLCPDVIAVVWRPQLFQPRAFSALNSEYVAPVTEEWTSDTMVTTNVHDILRETARITSDIVTDVKVFGGTEQKQRSRLGTKRKASDLDDESESESSSEE